jgi:hypothetical protein
MITYSDVLGTQEKVAKVIDSIPDIVDWRYDMQNCIYFKSRLDSTALSTKIRAKLPKGRFIIVEIGNNKERNGYLKPETWDFIRGEN